MLHMFARRLRERAAAIYRDLDLYTRIGLLGLCVGLAWCWLCRHDAGITLDEAAQMRYGRRIAAWFTSGFNDQRAILSDFAIARYGGLFDALTQLAVHFTPGDALGTRHAGSALCALAGIAAAWMMAERIAGRRAGLFAAALLACTPVWIGHGLFNPKDIPFGAASAWGLWGALGIITDRELPSYRSSIVCGLALGAALGVRPGGMFLLGYPALAWACRLWLQQRSSQPQTSISQTVPRLLTCWAAAWICMLLAWPWAQLSPLAHPVEAFRFAAHSPWGGTTLFEGQQVSAQHLPRSYLPKWFAITLPETYLLAALCAVPLLWAALKRGRFQLSTRQLAAALLCLASFGPILAQIAGHTPIYDAQRHFLFVLPPLAALGGAAISQCLHIPSLSLTTRAAVLGSILGALGVVSHDMLRLHPYEYVYFSHLIGGLPGAADRFETEYWGASYTEGLDWLAAQLDPNDRTPVRVATCNNDDSVRQFLQTHPEQAKRIKLEPRASYADILLASTRYNCHKTQGELLHVVQRMGVPFLYVLQRRALVSNGNRTKARGG